MFSVLREIVFGLQNNMNFMKHKHNYLDHTILENLKKRDKLKFINYYENLIYLIFFLRIFNLSLIQLKILYKLCYYTL